MMKDSPIRVAEAKANRSMNTRAVLGRFLAVSWLAALVESGLAQIPPYEWVRKGGGPQQDSAFGIASDTAGNVYVTGSYASRAMFGGTQVGISNDYHQQLFVAKMDSAGNYLWVKAPAGATSDSDYYYIGRAIAVDPAGAVYVAGDFRGSVNFGAFSLTSPNAPHVLIAKYSSAGTALWGRSVGDYATANGVAVGSDQRIHIVGGFLGTGTFGTTNVTAAGNGDIFHVTYNDQGQVVWVSKAGGMWSDTATAVAIDPDGSSFVVGTCDGPANFGRFPFNGHPQYGQGGGSYPSVFLAKYDSSGDVVWVVQLTSGFEVGGALGVATDGLGNCIVTGNFLELRYNGSSWTAGNRRVFVAKYDASGSLQWLRASPNTDPVFGTGGLASGHAVAVDSAGNCYVAGGFAGTNSFGTTNLTSIGDRDIFIAKYTAGGVLAWVKQAGLVLQDFGAALALDANANIYLAGKFTDSANFDSTYITSAGMGDAFIAKLPAVAPVPPRIIAAPQPQNVLAGSNTTFSVEAGGTQPLSYQWQFYGTNLVGATNASIIILNAQPNNVGPYRVVISNAGGSVTSSVATMTIVYPPDITVPSQSQIVTAGTDVNFGVTTTGTAPLTYRWHFNGANIATGTNALLVISNAQPANGGSYTVVVTNAYGAVTSSVATLTVRYSLTVNVAGGGTVTRNPSFTNYPPNLTVTLTPAPGAGYVFNFWSGDASGNASPLTVMMTTNKIITANFASTAVTIATQGEGSVGKSPDRPFYNVGEQVTLTATPGRWFGFTRWGDGPTANPRVVTIGVSNHYMAIFSPTTAVETLTFGNVSRTAPVGMPALFVDGEFVVTGAVSRLDIAEVSMLTTFPNGSIFYTLDGSAPSFAAHLYSGPFVLRRSATVRALAYDSTFLNSREADPVYVSIEPTFQVNASTAGGGTVGVLPSAASYRSNTLVVLSAAPAPGWTFLQWLGDASGTSATTSVRVTDRDLCAQALFGTTLGTTVAGNGTVIVDPAASLYPHGTVVRLTAVPQPGNYFGAWGNAAMSTNNPLLFLVTSANPTVSCVLGPLNAGQVALTVLTEGRGRVTMSPRGNRFPSGQIVTLIATADADQEFLGWTGDATGTSTNQMIVMSQSKTITANFTRRPRLTLGPCLGGWREEGFQLTLTGEFGVRYRIEQSSGLTNWSTLGTLTNLHGISQVTDITAINDGSRYYRALEVP